MKQLHKTQRAILNKLLYSTGLRYSEAKPSKLLPNNKFDFHLDQLIKLGLIRHDNNLYLLTTKGKDYTNRIDREAKTLNQQAKLSVVVIPVKNDDEYLVYTRLK